MSVSVLILTYNEADNISKCLESVSWSDDVVVFDSFSTDGTPDIARKLGARVIQHKFENYGSQREAARAVQYKYTWVIALDADETIDNELALELRNIASAGLINHNAYRMRRKDFFLGRWIKHATLYPSWFVRFYRVNRIYYDLRTVHEYPTVDGSIGELTGHLIHHSFSKGIEAWIHKHNRYSTFEARENLKSMEQRLKWGNFLSRDPVERRRFLKELSFRMPFRPALRFFYMYLIRLGFLDGRAGFIYCRLIASYERMIVLKLLELRRRARGLPI